MAVRIEGSAGGPVSDVFVVIMTVFSRAPAGSFTSSFNGSRSLRATSSNTVTFGPSKSLGAPGVASSAKGVVDELRKIKNSVFLTIWVKEFRYSES